MNKSLSVSGKIKMLLIVFGVVYKLPWEAE